MKEKTHVSCIHFYLMFLGAVGAILVFGTGLYVYEALPLFAIKNWCTRLLGLNVLHSPWHEGALVLISLWIFIAIILQMKTWHRTRVAEKFLQHREQNAKGEAVLSLMKKLQISQNRMIIVNDPHAFAITKGIFFPKILVSQKLLKLLTNNEFGCVLTHEYAHLKHRDPLRLVCLHILSNICFFIPTVKEITEKYMLHQEFAADAEVLRFHDRKVLLSAMMKIIQQTQHTDAASGFKPADAMYGFVLFSPLKERFTHIMNSEKKHHYCTHFSRRKLFVSAFVGITILFIFVRLGFAAHAETQQEQRMCLEWFQRAPNMSSQIQSMLLKE